MIYKGGPKNYNKRDWQILGGIVVASIAAAAVAVAISPHPSVSATATAEGPLNPEFRKEAERAGYKGEEANEVGAAAERLCQGSGQC